MKTTELRHNLVVVGGNPAGFVKGNLATVDNIFENLEVQNFLSEQGFEVSWQDGIFEKIAKNRKYYETEEVENLKKVRLWQLKNEVDADMKFKSYEENLERFGEPKLSDYSLAFDGEILTNDLEEIYQIFGEKPPHDCSGHSIAISDVVELYDENCHSFYYVDRFGFKEILL